MAKADSITINTDPSKLNQDLFVSGTHWTPAGWTRLPSNIKTATESSLGIKWEEDSRVKDNLYIDAPFDYANALPQKLTFSIDKNDMKQGNKILVNTIQQLPTDGKQSSESNMRPILVSDGLSDYKDGYTVKDSNGKNVGLLTIGRCDTAEIDVYFTPSVTMTNLASNPTFSYDFSNTGRNICANPNDNSWGYNNYYSYKHNLKYPLYYSVITNSQVLNYKIDFKKDFIPINSNPTTWDNFSFDNWGAWDNIGQAFDNDSNQKDGTVENSGYVFKIQVIHGNPLSFSQASVSCAFRPYNENNKSMNTSLGNYWNTKTVKRDKDDLTNIELWNATPENEVHYSMQPDGTALICNKVKVTKLTSDLIKNAIDKSYLANVQDPEHYQDIVNNTLNNTKGVSHYDAFFSTGAANIGQFDIVTDVTPSFVHKTNLGTKNYTPGWHDGSSTAEMELYRNTTVQYIDDTTGDTVATDSLVGRYNQPTSYKVNVPKGYVLSKNQPTSSKYTWSDDKTNVNYTFDKDQKVNDANPIIIHLTHEQKQVNGQEEAKRTIKYVYGSDDQGTTAHPDVPQSVTFSGTQDSVTGKLSDLKPSGQWDQVVSPDIKGYTPDLKVVQSETPNPNDNKTVYVHYLANDEKAKLRVIDDHTGLELQGYDEEANGKFDTAISFNKNPNDVAKELENKGYKIVSNSWQDGSKYQDGKNEFVIHVDHTTSTQTENHAQTRTIHYVDGKGNKMSDDVVQKASFTRTGTKDNVTGQIDWKDWTTTDKYTEVSSPAHDGYTPDKAKVDAVTPLYGQNQDQTVVYHRNSQGAEITYVDDTTGKVLKHEQVQGKYNDKIVFNSNVPDTIKGYEDQGYDLVSNDFKDQNYSSDNTANKFTVHFKHGTKQVTRDKNVSQDIDYQIKENGTTHSVNHYKAPDLKFTQSGVQDNVTKETNWNGTVKDQQFKAVNTPTIKGYTPDIKQVPTTNIHVDSSNWNQDQNIKKTVTYTPDTESIRVIAKDRDTNKIINQSQLTGTYGSEYHATAPKITGYHLVKTPANASGKFGTDNADVVYLYVKDTPTDNSETTGTPSSDDTSVFQQNLTKQDTNDLPEMSEANMAVTTLAGLGLLALTGLVPVIRRKIRN